MPRVHSTRSLAASSKSPHTHVARFPLPEQSAEFVCAKAIRDGVIDAVLDHENGWMQSNEVSNVYATDEPQRYFHNRINFCLEMHNEAVRAMRYPADAYKKPKKPEEPEKSEEELAKEIEEELAEEE